MQTKLTTREQILAAAKATGLRIRTYEVRWASPWHRQPPCLVDAHTIEAACVVAEAEHPGMWIGQVVTVG